MSIYLKTSLVVIFLFSGYSSTNAAPSVVHKSNLKHSNHTKMDITKEKTVKKNFIELTQWKSKIKNFIGMGDPELSNYMKKVLSEGIPIKVGSNDLAQVATFKNLIIVWESERGGGTVTGSRPDLASLQGATGHAEISFTLNSSFKNIPKIGEFLKNHYECIFNTIKVTEVTVTAYFYDEYGQLQGKYQFELKEQNNVVEYNIFNKLKGQIKNVTIELLSFSVHLEATHSF